MIRPCACLSASCDCFLKASTIKDTAWISVVTLRLSFKVKRLGLPSWESQHHLAHLQGTECNIWVCNGAGGTQLQRNTEYITPMIQLKALTAPTCSVHGSIILSGTWAYALLTKKYISECHRAGGTQLQRNTEYITPLKKLSFGPSEALCCERKTLEHRGPAGFLVSVAVQTPHVSPTPSLMWMPQTWRLQMSNHQ